MWQHLKHWHKCVRTCVCVCVRARTCVCHTQVTYLRQLGLRVGPGPPQLATAAHGRGAPEGVLVRAAST